MFRGNRKVSDLSIQNNGSCQGCGVNSLHSRGNNLISMAVGTYEHPAGLGEDEYHDLI